MTLHGDAARLVAEGEHGRMAAWRGERPLFDSRFGARTLGSLAEVQVGCEVWTDLERRRTAHDQALGGIVLRRTDRVTRDDEVTVRAGWQVYDYLAPWHRAFRFVYEDDVTQDGCEAISPSRVTNTIYKFCRVIGQNHGLFLPEYDNLLHDAAALSKALSGGNRG